MQDPHLRPRISSPRYDAPRGGRLLTDASILRYILSGHYGEARRIAALANLKTPKKRTPKTDTMSKLIKQLKAL